MQYIPRFWTVDFQNSLIVLLSSLISDRFTVTSVCPLSCKQSNWLTSPSTVYSSLWIATEECYNCPHFMFGLKFIYSTRFAKLQNRFQQSCQRPIKELATLNFSDNLITLVFLKTLKKDEKHIKANICIFLNI